MSKRLPKLRPLTRREIVDVVTEECDSVARMMDVAGQVEEARTARQLSERILARVMEPAE